MGQNNDLGRATRGLALLAALAFAGCGDADNKTPVAKPERATATTSASASASGSVALAPSASASAQASSSPSAEALASASASAEPATAVASESAAPKSSGAPSSSVSAQAKAAPPPMPAAKNGILAAGAADKILKLGATPIVKLIDAGAEPREKTTYSFAKGAEQKVEIALEIGVKMRVGAQSMPSGAMPRMTMLMALTAGDKNDAGDVQVNGKLVKLGLEPEGAEQKQIADAILPELDGVKGMPLTYWISPRGRVRDLKMDATKFGAGAAQVVQGMSQSMESMVAPLPDDAIGLGASWQVVSRLSSAGADILQYETYVLQKRDGAKLALDVSIAQLAASDTIGGAAMPAGASAKLLSFKSFGSGDRDADTKKLATDRGTLKMKSAIELSVSQAGQPTQATQVDTAMTARFRKPK